MDQRWTSNHTLIGKRRFWLLANLLLGFVLIFEGVLSQATVLDEVTDFCERVYHQSVVVNSTLYIDGGLATLAKNDSRSNITVIPGNLFAFDLKSSWFLGPEGNSTMTRLGHDFLPGSTLVAPKLSRGALYSGPSNDTKIYFFGGTAITNDYGEDSQLWTYDAQNKGWGTFYSNGKRGTGPGSLINPASGANVGVPKLGLGFWFNGEQDNRTSAAMQVMGEGHRFLDGMVVFNFNSGTAKNISTGAVSPGARVRGKVVYAPGVGGNGSLVLIGGAEKVAGVVSNDWRGSLVDMGQIHILDIASLDHANTPNGTWYQQKALGTIPESRIDHCLVLASAQDGSSHNIYMYAGRDGSGTLYDDVYILTLPSFQWIKVYQGPYPRYGMTCDLVGQRQMMVVGGSRSTTIGQECDIQKAGVASYDLSAVAWSSYFNVNAEPYEVPKLIRDVVGGSPTGGATVVKPVNGFSDSGLALLFSGLSPGAIQGTSTSTSNSSDTRTPHSNTGAIAGGVVGGLAIVGLISLALFMLHRCHTTGIGTGLKEEKERSYVLGEMNGTSANRFLGNAHELPAEIPVQELDVQNIVETGHNASLI